MRESQALLEGGRSLANAVCLIRTPHVSRQASPEVFHRLAEQRESRTEEGHLEQRYYKCDSIGVDIKLYIYRINVMSRKANTSRQTRALLEVMLDDPQAWHYGYELSKKTGLKSGTLYPLLIRLSEQGFLASEWEEAKSPGKPPRHVYKLTAPGLALGREQARLDAKSAIVGKPSGARA